MGTAAPPALHQFLRERELWKQLGLTRADIAGRPHREIAETELFISLIQREEAIRARAARR